MGGSQSSPVGGGGVGDAGECPCGNGILRKGSRVKTQYTRAEGGDDRWYSGTITKVFANHRATIHYDDGDKWTGDTQHIFLLQPNAGQGGLPVAQQPAPGMTVMTATVPPGAMAGTPIPVMMPNGQPFHVAVPAGLMPGQTFQFQAPMMPQSPPVATAVPVQQQGPPVVVYGQPVEAQPVAGQPTKF